ncbi:MAG: hypothetical protein IKX51_00530 [Bacteroidales bacterium]|nr:hypothetical protein [Bacteroidales bacterium]
MKENNKPLKIIALSLFVIGVAVIFAVSVFSSCKKDYEEVHFSGTVVGCLICNTKTWGYIIDLDTPSNYGDSVEFDGQQLKDSSSVSGVCYKTSDYGKINCQLIYKDDMQEVIILDID